MQWLFPSVVSTFCATLIFTSVYMYLYFSEKEKYFAVWTISWSVYSLRYICILIMLQTGPNKLLQLSIQLFPLIGAVFLLYGTGIWLKKRISVLWFVVSGGISIWIIVSILFQFSFLLSTLPSFLVMGAIYVWIGVEFIRFHQHKSVGKHITGWAFILWGVHKMDYPFLRPVEWFAPLGFLLAALFTVIAAIGIVLIYFEMKKYELQQSEARWRSLTENSPDHILTLDTDLRIQFANFASPGLTLEELIGTPLHQYVEGQDKQVEVKAILENVLKTSDQASYDTVYNISDGGTIYYESTVVPRKLEGSEGIIGLTVSSRNITDRKQAEIDLLKNQYYLSKAQEIGTIGTWELDLKKNILIWTDENYKIFGVPLGTPLNYEIFLNCIHPDDRDYVNEKWTAALKKESYDIEHRLIIDGKIRWVREKAEFEFDEQDNPSLAIGFTQDITNFKQAQEQIKTSLTEKETLLHEIHHRVKNNMQVINSLLNLQANNIQDEQVKSVLKDSQSRVFAMSAVHETLHGSKNLSEIDLKSYLSKITTSIFQTYLNDHQKIKLNSNVEESPISLNQAYPLGLVINELISNSMKYAFPADRTGEITINLNKHENEFKLIVSDDGVGMPEGFDWRKSNTLGLQLIKDLIEKQLKGSIDLDKTNGTKFTIKFQIESSNEK